MQKNLVQPSKANLSVLTLINGTFFLPGTWETANVLHVPLLFGTWFCTGAYFLRSQWCESGCGCAVSGPADSSGCVCDACVCQSALCTCISGCAARYAAWRESDWVVEAWWSQGRVQHGRAQCPVLTHAETGSLCSPGYTLASFLCIQPHI